MKRIVGVVVVLMVLLGATTGLATSRSVEPVIDSGYVDMSDLPLRGF